MRRAFIACVVVALACSDKPIGPPAGDNNFDDPDDPGDPGQGNHGPDAALDANGQFCVASRDCPAVFVCAYPIADMCGAAGRCLPYNPDGGCEGASVACGCTNMPVVLCAPQGYAPAPVQSVGACEAGAVDAGSDATSDAETNDAGDAASE